MIVFYIYIATTVITFLLANIATYFDRFKNDLFHYSYGEKFMLRIFFSCMPILQLVCLYYAIASIIERHDKNTVKSK